MPLEKVVLSNGDVVMLEPKRAAEVRVRIKQLQDWDRTVSRECRQLHPSLYGSGLKGRTLGHVSGSNSSRPEKSGIVVKTPDDWKRYKAAERKTLIESRWKSIAS